MNDARTAPPPRPEIAALHPYIPGEQPRLARIVKLNTNENAHGPAPAAVEALRRLDGEALRKYPDPGAAALREAVAGRLGVESRQVVAGNGSDEILRLAFEAYAGPGDKAAWLWPTYSLYPVFADKGGVRQVAVPFEGGSQEDALDRVPEDAKLVLVANPNPPFGAPVAVEAIRRLADRLPGALVVSDEAYIAFGGESAVALVREGVPNVFVSRSFSKSHSLAGMRVGFGVGAPEVVRALSAIKDSYNLSAAAQAAALAAWGDQEWLAATTEKILAERGRAMEELRRRGFEVPPSAGNFVFARREGAGGAYHRLKERGILVRWFDTEGLRGGIRITIGSREQMDALYEGIDALDAEGA